MLCHISILKWKLNHLHSHALTLTLFPFPASFSQLRFSWSDFNLSAIASWEMYFHCLKVILVLNLLPRVVNIYVFWLNNGGKTSKRHSWLPFICKMMFAATHWPELPTDLYLFFIHLSVPNNLFSVTPFMCLDKQKPWEDVQGQDQTPAEHVNHSFNRK